MADQSINIDLIKKLIEESNPLDWKRNSYCGVFYWVELNVGSQKLMLEKSVNAGIDMATGIGSGIRWSCYRLGSINDRFHEMLGSDYVEKHYDRINNILSDIEHKKLEERRKKNDENFVKLAWKYLKGK